MLTKRREMIVSCVQGVVGLVWFNGSYSSNFFFNFFKYQLIYCKYNNKNKIIIIFKKKKNIKKELDD